MTDWQMLFERLIAIVLGCAGLWYLFWGLARLCFPNPERTWKPVAGVMQESSVEKNDDGDGTTYSVRLQYGYHYRGIDYINDRIAPLQFWTGVRWTAESYARKYPRGREVTVYVNPRNPGKSVLEPGRQVLAALCYSLLGVVFCTIAWLSTWMS